MGFQGSFPYVTLGSMSVTNTDIRRPSALPSLMDKTLLFENTLTDTQRRTLPSAWASLDPVKYAYNNYNRKIFEQQS